MIWYDMIFWYYMIWYDMISYDIIWYHMILFYDIIWYFIIWYHMILYDLMWYDMILCDMIWYIYIIYNIQNMLAHMLNACILRVFFQGRSWLLRVFCPGDSDHHHRHGNDHHRNDAWRRRGRIPTPFKGLCGGFLISHYKPFISGYLGNPHM